MMFQIQKYNFDAITRKRVITIMAFLFCVSFGATGQHHELLNLTEKQVRQKVKAYHSVTRDSSEHEFVPFLIFRNNKNEVELICTFFAGKCYMAQYYSLKETLDSAVKSADKQYDRIGNNYWRDRKGQFEVQIISTPDKVITMYNRGVSHYD
ncbi:hypothetical protein ACD591_00170 [Rufibacter glacialis]|uniref:Uncharacterized protein n=1 Tax=Rufibacter glacialis TaxID=1259555 RepID=A0A5M8QJ81_9BACT|nr:hypothetical protein [Rufibacter glacialis]KAA6435328.1 hypothetical protein FOE74_05085 [Rufibacter glacialis]GGK62394.1 hypothetical protein GCM10011405_08130 [Rufibacter glacialis]